MFLQLFSRIFHFSVFFLKIFILRVDFPEIAAFLSVNSRTRVFVLLAVFYHLLLQSAAFTAVASAFCFMYSHVCAVGDVADGDDYYEYYRYKL